jgi:hypothetical protein
MNCVLLLAIIHEEMLARQSLQPRCTSFPMSPIPIVRSVCLFYFSYQLIYVWVTVWICQRKELGGEWFGWQQ